MVTGNWDLMMIQKGISRAIGRPPKQKSPITIPILLTLHRTLSDTIFDKAFWAAALIAFYGFFRKSTRVPTRDFAKFGQIYFERRCDWLDFVVV